MTENKRSRGLVVAVVVVVLLVGGSLVALLLNRDDDGAGQATPPVQPTAAQPDATSSPAAEAQPPLTAAPDGVSWELFQGVALPTSRADGPTRVVGPVHAGFTRTPTGALLAAAQVGVRIVATPEVSDLLQVVDTQLAPGAGKAAYRNLLSNVTTNEAPPGGYRQYVGFRYLAYTPDVAVVSLATQGRTGALRAATSTMRWLDGDWRLEKPADGQEPSQSLQDLGGYIPWRGAS